MKNDNNNLLAAVSTPDNGEDWAWWATVLWEKGTLWKSDRPYRTYEDAMEKAAEMVAYIQPNMVAYRRRYEEREQFAN